MTDQEIRIEIVNHMIRDLYNLRRSIESTYDPDWKDYMYKNCTEEEIKENSMHEINDLKKQIEVLDYNKKRLLEKLTPY